ncbi:glycoside hydrolase [Schizopora paradoxa]|uniref:glucan endo-1,3-beta-D-glucosidase n=1 Tax=Schizopora paradoxa TaxID=27342 RepID=A0A0H2S4H4_9AGAM|nr:glycoside hydrolase [Schizopora paradoxa]
MLLQAPLALAAPAPVLRRGASTNAKVACSKRRVIKASSDAVNATLSASANATDPAISVNGVVNVTISSGSGSGTALSRMDIIKDMYAFAGFVYALDNCPSQSKMTSDFKEMKSKGARTVITFDICGDGKTASYYEQAIAAAGDAGMYIIPLAWTLFDDGQSFTSTSIPRMQAVTSAVIKNPDPVLAIAYGDEPLYDNDAGSPATLAKAIKQMKAQLTDAGLDIPVSISDMAYGWRSAGSAADIAPMVAIVDFFMINNFPFFAQDATTGGAPGAWTSFANDMKYFQSIAKGKPLMVTQTGWSTSRVEFAPNSPDIDLSYASQYGYWHLLDSHCASYFKEEGISWMWRSWDDDIVGWGVLDANGKPKFDIQAKTTC